MLPSVVGIVAVEVVEVVVEVSMVSERLLSSVTTSTWRTKTGGGFTVFNLTVFFHLPHI